MHIAMLLLSLFGTANAATLTVDAEGGGDYTSIQAAIDAAANGDTIEVRAGTYEEWSSTVGGIYRGVLHINKSVDIVGDGVAQVFVHPPSRAVSVDRTGALAMTAGNYNATLSGMTIEHTVRGGATGTYAYTTVSESSAYDSLTGSLLINNVAFRLPSSGSKSMIYKNNTNFQVVFENCVVDFGETYAGAIAYNNRTNSASIFRNGIVKMATANTGFAFEYSTIFASGPPAGTGNGTFDPQFVDAPNLDYTLGADSLAINAGNPSTAFNDTDGSRNDMGVFGGPDAVGAFVPSCPALHDEVLRDGVSVCIHPDATVPDTATLGAWSIIGPNTIIAPRANIGAGARIWDGVIVGRGATVGAGASIGADSILSRACVVGADAIVQDNVLVGYAAQVGGGTQLGPFAIVGNLVQIGVDGQIGLTGTVVIARRAILNDRVELVGPGVVGPEAHVHDDVTGLGQLRIRKNATVGAGATLGNNARLGRDSTVEASVTLGVDVTLRADACAGVDVPNSGYLARSETTCGD
ncbi:MAG: carbonic anhydrase/acetyltransferase-like protein (isoleucine patch superfamily) [Myxococcota bacterium]|jgi:carbonic anhydrase/acetyltransferase-like protein (isoleucine patch superfamily)